MAVIEVSACSVGRAYFLIRPFPIVPCPSISQHSSTHPPRRILQSPRIPFPRAFPLPAAGQAGRLGVQQGQQQNQRLRAVTSDDRRRGVWKVGGLSSRRGGR